MILWVKTKWRITRYINKIKEIEKREAQLMKEKKSLTMCTSCQTTDEKEEETVRPEHEIDRVRRLLGASPQRQQPVERVRQDFQAQTEENEGNLLQDMDENEEVKSEINEQNEQIQTQNVREIVQSESNNEQPRRKERRSRQNRHQRPVFRSIRERYAHEYEQERNENQLVQAANSQPIESRALIEEESQIEGHSHNEQDRAVSIEDLIPEGNERAAQGIIQLLSSKLLSQILSAGDLFQSEISERFEEEIENMKHRYFAIWYEKLLKARIFLGKLYLS